ncbi:MAG TPA: NifU family protein [Myxococcota bacterium]|jgi:Fe/S biogenesis protein NfuA|nr:NifU family protein [Myxococcota bacterium]
MRRKIQRIIDEEINPAVASHGGRIELVDFVDDKVYLKMMGGCQGCASSSLTLRQGIESLLREEIPDIKDIVDVTDHAAGSNPYYQPSK